MKKIFLMMMIASGVTLCEACNTGSSSKEGVDSTRTLGDVPSNRDTSKVTTTLGSATTLDLSGSGGTKIVKGRPSSRTTMTAPAAAADTAAKDTTKK